MVKVWDLFVRLSHWLIVLLVISAWLSANYGDAEFKWHTWNGYVIFVLVLSRIIWAIVGSTTAQFKHFVKLPHTVFYYLRDVIQNKDVKYLGHNPAGGWMVVVILFVLLAQTITGMFSSDDIISEGPFVYYASTDMVKSMTGWHHFLFDALIVLVVLHVAAVLYHQFIKKEKLIQAMFNGSKANHNNENLSLKFRPFYIAVFIIALIAFAFWMVLRTYS